MAGLFEEQKVSHSELVVTQPSSKESKSLNTIFTVVFGMMRREVLWDFDSPHYTLSKAPILL